MLLHIKLDKKVCYVHAPKAEIKSSFCVVARYLTEKRRFEQQKPVKIKCSQLSCDQPQKEDLIAALPTKLFHFSPAKSGSRGEKIAGIFFLILLHFYPANLGIRGIRK